MIYGFYCGFPFFATEYDICINQWLVMWPDWKLFIPTKMLRTITTFYVPNFDSVLSTLLILSGIKNFCCLKLLTLSLSYLSSDFKKVKTRIFIQKWLVIILLATLYHITIAIDPHQTLPKCVWGKNEQVLKTTCADNEYPRKKSEPNFKASLPLERLRVDRLSEGKVQHHTP